LQDPEKGNQASPSSVVEMPSAPPISLNNISLQEESCTAVGYNSLEPISVTAYAIPSSNYTNSDQIVSYSAIPIENL
jgi:hypothetical protein